MAEMPDAVDPLLMTGLRRTLERLGWEAFVSGPLIVHDRACFPDSWTEDAMGLHRACRRALLHAGHPSVSVRILDRRTGRDPQPGTDLLHLAAVEDGTAAFAVFGLAAPKLLLHQLALEVGRLALVLAEGADSPYRDGGDGPTFPKDKAATLAEVALGFGTIALDGSAQLLKAESVDGGFVVGHSRRNDVGGLPAPACASLLATQLVVRARDELPAVLRCLGEDVRPLLEENVTLLEAQRDALIRALGLPDPDTWPEPTPVDGSPLAPDPEGEASAKAAEQGLSEHVAAPNAGEVAFRVPDTHGLRGLAVGGILGGIGAGVTGSALVLLAGLVGGFLVGRLVLVSQVCSSCERRLPEGITSCPGCGASIVGSIASRDDRLAAEEAHHASLGPEADVE